MFASFEKDYIMRIVREMVRMLLKMLFNIDVSRSMEDVIKDAEEKEILRRLLKMIDDGQINQAENELYDITYYADRRYLKTALIFYYRLAEKDEEFLLKHNYTAEEIRDGVQAIAERYGIKDMADICLSEDF